MRTFLAAAATSVVVLAQSRPAEACGGCFHDPTQNPTVVTDHRMVLSMSLAQTTLYDQIHYSGSPQSFAWVLPITGTATVGLSADIVFDALDTMTHTTVYAPPLDCPSPPPSCQNLGGTFADASATPGVQVLKDEVVGPYETVQLQSTDPQALDNWLTSHGFAVPADIQPVIDAYVSQGSNFLAMKLVPGATVQSMRPVRVTTQGASPVLPLRMVAAGTGSTVGITLWVVSEGRYEPQNFPFFRVQDSELVWDYLTQSSNYAEVRQAKEQASGDQAWEIESSLALDVFSFKQLVDNGGYPYPYYAYDAGADYLPVSAPDGGDAGGETATQVRDDDLATLFSGIDPNNTRVTRIRTDIGRSALAQDLLLQASVDQSTLTNLRYPASSINKPPCPTYGSCSSGPDAGYPFPGLFTGGGGCSCGAAPSTERLELLGGLGGVVAVAAYRLRRRRKR